MGQRGPIPKPKGYLVAVGSSHAYDRRLEPAGEVVQVLPPPPPWISDAGKNEWERFAGYCISMGVFQVQDLPTLSLLCDSFAQYIAARDDVISNGTISQSDKGGEYLSPRCSVQNMAFTNLLKLCREFGLTPSARASLGIAQTKNSNPVRTRERKG